VIPALAAGLVRHGSLVFAPLLLVELVGAALLLFSARLARWQGERATWMVGPVALVVWAGLTFSATSVLEVWPLNGVE
jgi:hypothetical protein